MLLLHTCYRLHIRQLADSKLGGMQKHKPTDHLWKMERIAKDMMAELRVGSYPDAGVTSLQVRSEDKWTLHCASLAHQLLTPSPGPFVCAAFRPAPERLACLHLRSLHACTCKLGISAPDGTPGLHTQACHACT